MGINIFNIMTALVILIAAVLPQSALAIETPICAGITDQARYRSLVLRGDSIEQYRSNLLRGLKAQVQDFIAEQKVYLKVLSGKPPLSRQSSFLAEDARFICTPFQRGKFAVRPVSPKPCRMISGANQAAAKLAMNKIQETIQDNIENLEVLAIELKSCGPAERRKSAFNLIDGETTGAGSVPLNSPANQNGLFSIAANFENSQDRQLDVAIRRGAVLHEVFRKQIADLFADFRVEDLATGNNLSAQGDKRIGDSNYVLVASAEARAQVNQISASTVRVAMNIPPGLQSQFEGSPAVVLDLLVNNGSLELIGYRENVLPIELNDERDAARAISEVRSIETPAKKLYDRIRVIQKEVEQSMIDVEKTWTINHEVRKAVASFPMRVVAMTAFVGLGAGILGAVNLVTPVGDFLGPSGARIAAVVPIWMGWLVGRKFFDYSAWARRYLSGPELKKKQGEAEQIDRLLSELTKTNGEIKRYIDNIDFNSAGCFSLQVQQASKILKRWKSIEKGYGKYLKQSFGG